MAASRSRFRESEIRGRRCAGSGCGEPFSLDAGGAAAQDQGLGQISRIRSADRSCRTIWQKGILLAGLGVRSAGPSASRSRGPGFLSPWTFELDWGEVETGDWVDIASPNLPCRCRGLREVSKTDEQRARTDLRFRQRENLASHRPAGNRDCRWGAGGNHASDGRTSRLKRDSPRPSRCVGTGVQLKRWVRLFRRLSTRFRPFCFARYRASLAEPIR